METKELARIFKAVADNVSREIGRDTCYIYAKNRHMLEATDGHALIRVTLPGDGHDFTPGFYEPKQSFALLKAGVIPKQVDAELSWPHTDQVIPSVGGDCELTSDGIGFNAALLARILDSVARITGDQVRTRFTFSCHLSPARIDAESNGIHVVAVVMPMRIKGSSEQPKPKPVPPPAPVVVTPSEAPAPVVETPAPTRGPRPGYTVTPKPCPVCGTPNAARRFSFLCESHRSPEYLAAHKRVAA